ncbi:flavoprotein [uncultured Rossellomorea sp.]|uniref:flavoprotein n=1 Tax=uncultured Rossellomorea sp. TaxID=2837549 RepID=UPI0026277CC4|nr:flavoprotein [uncultured Rossellomorea sp.]
MNDKTFKPFLDVFLDAWKNSSIIEFEKFISTDYQAREIRDGETVDFGYEESIEGWKQGFDFVKKQHAEWEIHEVSIIPMKEDEVMAILSATIVLNGEAMETCHLFFDTFKKGNNWKIVRSYIETGVVRGTDL